MPQPCTNPPLAEGQHPALEILARRLDKLRRQGLERRLVSIGPANGPYVTVQGRRLLLMASNDYLGLSRHPRLTAAAARAAQELGSGTGASRLVSGSQDGHLELEAAVARHKGTEAALVLATGYMTNLAAVAGLAGPGDLVVSDALNHASIIDACRLSRAEVKVYPHGDAAQARRLLAQGGEDRLKLLVTDGVFSMDGDLAPLPELWRAARQEGALLIVDDAHATGVYGATGRGSLEHFGMEPAPGLVLVGTFSKALGCQGGFVAGAREVISTLVHRARSLLYTTAPPPAQVAACRESLEVVREEGWRRERLWQLCAHFRRGLQEMGLTVLSEQGPIIPLLVGDAGRAWELAQALRRQGVFAPAMRPPTVPAGTSRIRFTVSAAHRQEDLDLALAALGRALREVAS